MNGQYGTILRLECVVMYKTILDFDPCFIKQHSHLWSSQHAVAVVFFFWYLIYYLCGQQNNKWKRTKEKKTHIHTHLTTKGDENVITNVKRPRKIDYRLRSSVLPAVMRATQIARNVRFEQLARKIQVSHFGLFLRHFYIFAELYMIQFSNSPFVSHRCKQMNGIDSKISVWNSFTFYFVPDFFSFQLKHYDFRIGRMEQHQLAWQFE